MSHTDILYIHPAKLPAQYKHKWTELWNSYVIIPMGVVGLINLIREDGLTVKGLNCAMEMDMNSDFNLRQWLQGQKGVRLIMIDLHWLEHAYGTMEVARMCKELMPDVPILLGGFTASFYAKEILEHFSQVDFIIRGDAEKSLIQLVKELNTENPLFPEIPNLSYRHNTNIIMNAQSYCAAPSDLCQLDFFNIDFLENFQHYYMYEASGSDLLTSRWICLGRGCSFNCPFCGGSEISQKVIAGREGMVLRSLDNIVEDIRRLNDAGIDQVSFSHDPAALGREYWSELFEKMNEKNISIGIYNECFQLPSKEFIQKFAENVVVPHSQLVFSPLSGKEKVRRFNGKLFSNSKFFKALSICSEYSIPIFVYFSTNLLLETQKTFQATLDMAQKIYDFYPLDLLKISNLSHTIDPCSPMSLEPKRYSIEVTIRSFMDYYNYCQKSPDVESDEELDNLRGFRLASPQKRSIATDSQNVESFL